MTELWVLRHAKASAQGPDGTDNSRPLTSKGRRQAGAVADYVTSIGDSGGPTPRTVLSSSGVRAVETAQLVMGALGPDAQLTIDKGLYTADVDDIVALLRLVDAGAHPVMVVGHNPVLHELAMLMLDAEDAAGRERLEAGLPTGALVVLQGLSDDWSRLSLSTATLKGLFVPPR
jgi:phosphohistidine phosphatase